MRLIKDSKCKECGAPLAMIKEEIVCTKCFIVYDDSPIMFGPGRMIKDDDGEMTNKPSAPITYLNPFSSTNIDTRKIKKRKD